MGKPHNNVPTFNEWLTNSNPYFKLCICIHGYGKTESHLKQRAILERSKLISLSIHINRKYRIILVRGNFGRFGRFACNHQNFTLQNFPAYHSMLKIVQVCKPARNLREVILREICYQTLSSLNKIVQSLAIYCCAYFTVSG